MHRRRQPLVLYIGRSRRGRTSVLYRVTDSQSPSASTSVDRLRPSSTTMMSYYRHAAVTSIVSTQSDSTISSVGRLSRSSSSSSSTRTRMRVAGLRLHIGRGHREQCAAPTASVTEFHRSETTTELAVPPHPSETFDTTHEEHEWRLVGAGLSAPLLYCRCYWRRRRRRISWCAPTDEDEEGTTVQFTVDETWDSSCSSASACDEQTAARLLTSFYLPAADCMPMMSDLKTLWLPYLHVNSAVMTADN